MPRKPIFGAACALIAFAATSCTADAPAFYNERTGAVAQCAASQLDPFGDECVATYKRAGWVEMTGPIIGREAPPHAAH